MVAPRNSEAAMKEGYSLNGYAALFLALAGTALFQFWGNATRGYIDTRSLFYWWGYQWFDPASDAQQGPLIIAISIGLFFRNWRRLPSLYPVKPDNVGFAILLGALALHTLGYATQQTRLSIVAGLLFCGGLLRLAGGLRGGRAAFFPIGFALLAIPVGFLQPTGFYLRLAVSEGVEVLLRWAGHPVIRNGTQLFSLDGHYEYDVAAACSGVRSLVALIALGVLLGYLRLPRWPARVVLVALVLPFALIGNLVRVLAIVSAGQFFGVRVATRVHDWSGFLVFGVVLALLLWVVEKLSPNDGDAFSAADEFDADLTVESTADGAVRAAQAKEFGGDTSPHPGAGRGKGRARAWLFWGTTLVLFSILVVIGVARVLDRQPPAANAGIRLAPNGIDPVALPEFIGTEWIGQRVDVTDVEHSILPPDTGYSRRNYVEVADRAHQVFISVVLSGRDRSSIHRPELCLIGQGWTIEGRTEAELMLHGGRVVPVTLLHVKREQWRPGGESQVVHSLLAYCFIGPDEVVSSHSAMLWRTSLGRVRHLQGERWAYVVLQTLLSPEESEAASLSRMEEVVTPVWACLKGL